ncbi:protein of unknown function [Paenibacillaceae bacterium GAS479]|nr:protein of unknown function [Paenibacillaceae bacterium GAS479]
MAKARVFISSVNEDGLKPLRRSVFRVLEGLGHEPLMWEENLGPWPSYQNPVEKCLEAVEQSDLYLLFIGTRGGTFDEAAGLTVTHSEFIRAVDKGKTALVWADAETKAIFFSGIAWKLDEYIAHTVQESGSYPAPLQTLDFLRSCQEAPPHIDPYVWLLLHDIRQRGIYVEDLARGVETDWRGYFSDLLRRGLLLLPLEPTIAENSNRLEEAETSFDLLAALLPQVALEPPHDWKVWLNTIRERLQGRTIEHRYGRWNRETVGSYEACNAASLYRRDGDAMRFISCCGRASAVRSFALNDQSSYIALTYAMGPRAEQVYYTESGQKFFYCVRSGPFVVTFHFPAGSSWDQLRYIRYKDSVVSAIIGPNTRLVKLVRLLLGGMRA